MARGLHQPAGIGKSTRRKLRNSSRI